MFNRSNLAREMDALRRSLDQVFDTVPFVRPPVSRFAFLPGLAARQYPLINIFDDENRVYVECLAPGLDPEELSVTVENNKLTIRGEKNGKPKAVAPEAYHRSERAAGKFIRSMDIGCDIDPDKITAEYKHGLLLITLGKSEKSKPRRIQIIAGQ
ncbi:Hsp20/alpha crystallin family protein [bacterium]|nr:Hsp20/alpha crystallin family protein [candidate division CSSED10-310 bacterium]